LDSTSEELLAKGVIRTVPLHLLETYAPRYLEALAAAPLGVMEGRWFATDQFMHLAVLEFENGEARLTPWQLVFSRLVSNEKLIRILIMLEDMAFDHETYTTVQYGFNRLDYTWAGEPYRSELRLLRTPPQQVERGMVFHPLVRGGIAGMNYTVLPFETEER
jgi:hypothetical protein